MRRMILVLAIAFIPLPTTAQEIPPQQIVIPLPNPDRGRFLFASKGCVVCHSINGVGGHAGPELDPDTDDADIYPLDFAARMWRGAQAMTALQSMEFGYQIDLTGQEIADIAAFIASPQQRESFSEEDVPELLRGWTIDEPMTDEEWNELGVDAPMGESKSTNSENSTRGRLLADRWCRSCHVVNVEGEGGRAGPAFPSIAARPEMTEKHIRDWLSTPHAKMPEFINLSENDLGDLATYIMSLNP